MIYVQGSLEIILIIYSQLVAALNYCHLILDCLFDGYYVNEDVNENANVNGNAILYIEHHDDDLNGYLTQSIILFIK